MKKISPRHNQENSMATHIFLSFSPALGPVDLGNAIVCYYMHPHTTFLLAIYKRYKVQKASKVKKIFTQHNRENSGAALTLLSLPPALGPVDFENDIVCHCVHPRTFLPKLWRYKKLQRLKKFPPSMTEKTVWLLFIFLLYDLSTFNEQLYVKSNKGLGI